MKVSAVVPVYNVEGYLPQCLDSMLAQTLTDMEFICVDDGSTDRSGEILDAYAAKDPRIKVIHKKNEGYGVAMNTGLEAATGEYFAVLESDDFVKPTMYETLYENAVKFNADIVRSNYYDLSTPDGQETLTPKKITEESDPYLRPICPNSEKKVYTYVMHNWTGIYRMDFLNENNIRYHTTPGASYQDNGFFFRCFSLCKRLVYVPEHFYCYRIDNPGSSINNSAKVYAMTKEYDFIKDNLEKDGLWENLKDVYYCRLFRAMQETYSRIAASFKKEYRTFFRQKLTEAEKNGDVDWNLFNDWQDFLFKTLLRSERDYGIINRPGRSPVKVLVWTKCRIARKGMSGIIERLKRKKK